MSEVQGNGRRVLVVDDDPDTALMFAELLKQLGHAVDYVTSSQAVVDVAKRLRPWLVFLDIGMPNMDGYEVAGRLRDQPDGNDILLVAVTGWGQPDDRLRSRTAGFDHHMVKPVEPDDLQRLLAQP